MKDAKTYAGQSTPSVKIPGNQNISVTKDNYYGPFKVSYSGQQCKIKVINTSNELCYIAEHPDEYKSYDNINDLKKELLDND